MMRLAITTAYYCSRDAVILGGWANMDEKLMLEEFAPVKEGHLIEFAKRHVCFTGSVPHAWLLPQCAVAIIRGGAGTTAACLRAGIPLIVTPFGFDQGFMVGLHIALSVQ